MRKLTFTILSISLLTVMAGAAVAPALGAIHAHFSSSSPMTIQLIVSMPAFFIILTTFFFRTLCRLLKTRTLVLLGLALYVLAGAGAFGVDNITALLVLRALLGVSVGIIMPISTGLLAFYFPPEEQSRLMGLSAAMNQMGGVVATLLAGILASVEWRYAFLVYLAGLFAMLLVALFLPNERLAARESRLQLSTLVRFHPSVTSMFLIMLLFFVYPTNFAISAHACGVNTLTVTLIMVGLDLVAFAVGLMFAFLMRHFRRGIKYFAPIGFLCGYAVLSVSHAVPGLMLGSVIIGLANGVGVPYVNTIASIKGGKEAAVTVMPLISASLYLGQFLSPLLVGPIARQMGGNNAPYVVAVCIAALYLLQAFLTRKQHALPPAE